MSAAQTSLVPQHDVPRDGRSGFVRVGGRQVHYLEWGACERPPLVCLHGGGQTAYMYEELGAALRARYHVLAVDLPSHGDSDPLEAVGAESYAATLPPLLDEFGLSRIALVGASMGGMTSIYLGAAHPERVAAIALIDIGHQLEEQGVQRILDFLRAHESFGSLEEAAAAIQSYLPRRKPTDPRRLTRNLRQRPDGRWEWKHGLQRSLHQRPPDWRAQLSGAAEAAARLRCPVLVLRGAQSDVLSDEGARAIAELIPGARLEVIDQAGHLAAGDNPDSTLAKIRHWLADIGW
jgi:pimeloyl-ACP methyl ester carboxylesterase